MENCSSCISGLFGNLACVDCPKVEQEYRQSPLDWLEDNISIPDQPEEAEAEV